ncbi:hypothetical protein EJP67_18460 [Variovorax guangxiensis]|uniref:Uncharacterized protein n=1 Tax=Variovorax guangxiensis TaxID=1775474 RepID=A0A433MN19_9BURK|nr:hypothetical protein [Variovorax guangxiensis]RUR69044.1 hypothetical protein EJP67_18460 [Variovorax guangxiensis]
MQATQDHRSPSFTKKGPGRFHKQGRGDHQHLTLKQRRAGSYGKGLRNWITQKQAAARLGA